MLQLGSLSNFHGCCKHRRSAISRLANHTLLLWKAYVHFNVREVRVSSVVLRTLRALRYAPGPWRFAEYPVRVPDPQAQPDGLQSLLPRVPYRLNTRLRLTNGKSALDLVNESTDASHDGQRLSAALAAVPPFSLSLSTTIAHDCRIRS